jgi:hypothetical protein
MMDAVAFAAIVGSGLVMILRGGMSSSGLEAATYITSLYGAWRAGGRAGRSDVPTCTHHAESGRN